MRVLLGRITGFGIFAVVFALLAWFVHALFPPAAALEIKRAASDFAQAWTAGTLDNLSYDPRSGPDVGNADPRSIKDNTTWLTRGISAVDADRPIKVELSGNPTSNVDGTASQPIDVTWDLGRGRTWTYTTTLTLGSTDNRLRVLWRPSSIHPALQHGLILQSHRVLAARAPVETYRGTVFATVPVAQVNDQVAGELVGTTGPATEELSELDPSRIAPGDRVGVAGLQQRYDAQLAGDAGLEVDVIRDPRYVPLEPVQRVAFVSPPTPGKPLVLTLDDRWQRRAEDALAQFRGPAALVAVDVQSGQILADANGGTTLPRGTSSDDQSLDSKGPSDRGLQGQYPPGETFRLATMLAAYRSANLTATSPANCTPFTFQGQQFFNSPGTVDQDGVTLGSAFVKNCSTAFARTALMVSPDQLRSAASSLGFGDPKPSDYPEFLGTVPSTPPPSTDPDLAQVQNGAGEGGVLASPLTLARASATVASGISVAPTLVLTSPRTAASPVATLSAPETAMLQQLMQQTVAAGGPLAALQSVPGGQAAGIGGSAAYGPSTSAPRISWVTGYQGTVAFAVLLANPKCGVTQAAETAAAFLGSVQTRAAVSAQCRG